LLSDFCTKIIFKIEFTTIIKRQVIETPSTNGLVLKKEIISIAKTIRKTEDAINKAFIIFSRLRIKTSNKERQESIENISIMNKII